VLPSSVALRALPVLVAFGLALALPALASSAPALQEPAAREPVTVFCFGRAAPDEGDPEEAAERQSGIDDSLADLRSKLQDSKVLQPVERPDQADIQVEILGREGSRLMPKELRFQVLFRGRATPLRARTEAMGSWRSLIDQAVSGLESWAASSYYRIKGLPAPKAEEGVVLPEVQAQIDELDKRDPETRARAAVRLAAIGPRALPAAPALVGILNDWSKLKFRLKAGTTTPGERAAMALVDIGALDQLIEAFRTSDSWRVRQHAVYGMANSPDPSVEAVLAEALRDEQGEVRRWAARAFDLAYVVETSRLRRVITRPKDPAVIDPLIAQRSRTRTSGRDATRRARSAGDRPSERSSR